MNREISPGWRELCLKNAEKRRVSDFCSLDIEREVEDVVSCLSREELRGLNLDEFREFLRGDSTAAVPEPRFEERLRRELWWTMVRGLVADDRGVPQA
ncbi:MAG: hypothetical protein NZ990_12530 [Myxococcota bacterium]|nr:hypothetical protein [Myxococcota bacterium]